MLIRFTEFIKHNNHEINLYVVQETGASQNLCFRIYIKDGQQGTVNLRKNAADEWIINAENNFQWINEIKPLLISAVDKRISRNEYASSGRLK